jgi:hypothetical protein
MMIRPKYHKAIYMPLISWPDGFSCWLFILSNGKVRQQSKQSQDHRCDY